MNHHPNPYATLRRPARPDTGAESLDFSSVTIHQWGEESIVMRLRRHADGYTIGWRLYVPAVLPGDSCASGCHPDSTADTDDPASNRPTYYLWDVYPTPANGLFLSVRDAQLYALGELRAECGAWISPRARRAIEAYIDQCSQTALL